MGMWNTFKKEINKEEELDLKESLFCGDAAGRVSGKRKDFNDTD